MLVVLGLRLLATERQLEDEGLAKERGRLVDRIRAALLSELERIKLRQMLVVANGQWTEAVSEEPVVLAAPLMRPRGLTVDDKQSLWRFSSR